MGHSTHDEFFTELVNLLNTRKAKARGSVFLTQKRLTPRVDQPQIKGNQPSQPEAADERDGDEHSATSFADLHPAHPLPILIRATNGKSKERRPHKLKLATVVQPDELEAFYARYAEVCKTGMAALKPRDRTKRKAKAKKRKVGGGQVAAAS